MQSNKELSREVLRRAGALVRARDNRRRTVLAAGAAAVSLALIAVVAFSLPATVDILPRERAVSGTLGALFLHNDHLGYLVVGVLAFVLGVFVTLLALLSRRSPRTGGRDDEP